jgi:hypothetical protein
VLNIIKVTISYDNALIEVDKIAKDANNKWKPRSFICKDIYIAHWKSKD